MSTNTPSETPAANEYVGNVSWTRGDEFRSILRNQHRDIVGMPAGSITAFAGSAAPTGWLLCDGSEIPRAKYAALFKVLGTTYGTPSTGDVFKLPDLRGRAPIGPNSDSTAANTATRNVGDKGGDTRMQQHTHVQNAHDHALGGGQSFGVDFGGNGGGIATFGLSVGIINTNTYQGPYSATANTATNQNAGSGSSENMPPFIVLNYLIKT